MFRGIDLRRAPWFAEHIGIDYYGAGAGAWYDRIGAGATARQAPINGHNQPCGDGKERIMLLLATLIREIQADPRNLAEEVLQQIAHLRFYVDDNQKQLRSTEMR